MKINGKMHEIDQSTRQAILNYNIITSIEKDKSSADDIVKLTCSELAAIPYGKPLFGAKLVKGPACLGYYADGNPSNFEISYQQNPSKIEGHHFTSHLMGGGDVNIQGDYLIIKITKDIKFINIEGHHNQVILLEPVTIQNI